MKHNTYKPRTNVAALLALLLAFTTILANVGSAYAATLSTASVSLVDSRVSTASTYDFLASGVTTSTIKCIKFVFATTATGSTKPTSMVTNTAGALSGNYVPTPASWTKDVATDGTVKYTFGTGEIPASASARTVSITGMTNSNTIGSYFMQMSTFNNTDCSSSPVDAVTVGFVITDGQQVSASVDPTLTFALASVASGQPVDGGSGPNTNVASTTTTLPFGTVTSSTNKIAAQDLTVTTNAGNGYTIFTRYSGALTSNSFTISDLAGAPNSTPIAFTAAGIEGFGYTTNDSTLTATGAGAARFTTSGPKWAAFTGTNAEVAFSAAGVNSQTTRVGMQTGVAGTTEPGTYTTTVIFTATPIY